MKPFLFLPWCAIGMLQTPPVLEAQSSFQNLDFEQAQLLNPDPSDYYGRYPIEQALPGWQARIGEVEETLILKDGTFLSSAGITLMTPDFGGGLWRAIHRLAGDYTVYLGGGNPLPPGPVVPASIYQTGTVPSWARSLRFLTDYATDTVPFLFINDQLQDLSVTPLGPYLYSHAADMSSYAGSTVELRFTSYGLSLDDITFSSEPIPEPAAIWWLAVGVGGSFMISRRKKT